MPADGSVPRARACDDSPHERQSEPVVLPDLVQWWCHAPGGGGGLLRDLPRGAEGGRCPVGPGLPGAAPGDHRHRPASGRAHHRAYELGEGGDVGGSQRPVDRGVLRHHHVGGRQQRSQAQLLGLRPAGGAVGDRLPALQLRPDPGAARLHLHQPGRGLSLLDPRRPRDSRGQPGPGRCPGQPDARGRGAAALPGAASYATGGPRAHRLRLAPRRAAPLRGAPAAARQ